STLFLYWSFSLIDVDTLLPMAVDCLHGLHSGAQIQNQATADFQTRSHQVSQRLTERSGIQRCYAIARRSNFDICRRVVNRQCTQLELADANLGLNALQIISVSRSTIGVGVRARHARNAQT